jgi:hypothetical protein
VAIPVAIFRLVRANKSRGGDRWSGDDYDVYDGDRVIGRIMLHPQAPKDQPRGSGPSPRENRHSPVAVTRRAERRRWRISRCGGTPANDVDTR